MKPKIFKWRSFWCVTFCAGYDLGFQPQFDTWRKALDYVLGQYTALFPVGEWSRE